MMMNIIRCRSNQKGEVFTLESHRYADVQQYHHHHNHGVLFALTWLADWLVSGDGNYDKILFTFVFDAPYNGLQSSG